MTASPPPPDSRRTARPPAERASGASGDLRAPHGWQLALPSLGKNTDNVSAQEKRGVPGERPLKRRVWAESYELLDSYRDFAGERCRKCCRVRIAAVVESRKRDHGSHFHGVMRCGTAWECPVCQLALKVGRAQEVLQAVQWHTSRYGVESAALLTLTVRHGLGQDVRALRSGVAKAYQYFLAGRAWPEWKAAVGFVGFIRGLETTHGENGWHPHLHIVLLTERPLLGQDRTWFSERWQRAVVRALGPEHVPDDFHGCDLRPCHVADYLQKLGLEVSPPVKAGRGQHRTPLQLLWAFACDGDLDALELYQAYAIGMKGAKMLTWSRGLKVAAAVKNKSDQEVVDGEDGAEQVVLRMKGEAWDGIRDVPGIKVEILRRTREDAPESVRQWFRALPYWPPGYDPCEVDLSGRLDVAAADPALRSLQGGNLASAAAQALAGVS